MENGQGEKLPAGQAERTCLEAWFLGYHADMGGGSLHDGLSLWPLQWILSEASAHGLVLDFVAPQRLVKDIQDPLQLVMPTGKGPHQIPFKDHIAVNMWDLNKEFDLPGLKPVPNPPTDATTKLPTSERTVFTSSSSGSGKGPSFSWHTWKALYLVGLSHHNPPLGVLGRRCDSTGNKIPQPHELLRPNSPED